MRSLRFEKPMMTKAVIVKPKFNNRKLSQFRELRAILLFNLEYSNGIIVAVNVFIVRAAVHKHIPEVRHKRRLSLESTRINNHAMHIDIVIKIVAHYLLPSILRYRQT